VSEIPGQPERVWPLMPRYEMPLKAYAMLR
jgi:hypothetical protein